MGRLNCFAHFESKTEAHEDVLTRAYLVVRRLVPKAQEQFLALVESQRSLSDPSLPRPGSPRWTEPVFDTQTGSIPHDVSRVLSVLITDEDLLGVIDVEHSDRSPVYDGVITYGSEWAFIIENKPRHEGVWHEQLSPNLESHPGTETESRAVVLEWKQIIAGLVNLLQQDGTGPTARKLVEDFLDYAYENFAFLNPYSRLALCRGNLELLNNRCRQIMNEITPGRVGYHQGWRHFMRFEHAASQQVTLYAAEDPKPWGILLVLCPGDTMSQARTLYRHLDADGLQALAAGGCELEPNFHLSHMTRHLIWPATRLPFSDYVNFWLRHEGETKQLPIDEPECRRMFAKVLQAWCGVGLISEEDVPAIEEVTTETKRTRVNVCPGLVLTYSWSADAAVELDERGEFVDEVRGRLMEAFACWGQRLE